MLIRVASADDPRLAPYRDIKDAARLREGGFLVEGEIALRTLLGSRFETVSVFLSEGRAEKLAGGLPEAVDVFVAPQAVMDSVVGLPLHRGVLALANRPPETKAAGLLGSAQTVLVLINLANHDNIGACFRNAASLGADAILLDATCGDPLYRKSIRVSSGAVLSLPFVRGGTADTMIDALEGAGFTCWALTPSGGAALHTLRPAPRLALLLGAEGTGLPDKVMERCRRVSIPMAGGMDSLNVATAGAIALAHVQACRS